MLQLRPFVLPKPPPDDSPDPVAPQRPKKLTWADLLRRVFWIDPLLCPCGGRFRFVAVVRDPTSIQALCAALHLAVTYLVLNRCCDRCSGHGKLQSATCPGNWPRDAFLVDHPATGLRPA